MVLRELKTTPNENPWSEMRAKDREQMGRLFRELAEPETSELATGKKLVEAREIAQKYGEFLRFLETLPFTTRTAYRRIRMYEKASEMWPEDVVDRAIARRIPMIGVTAAKPMGAYEDVEKPHMRDPETGMPIEAWDITTGEKTEDFLIQAELQVRREAKRTTKKRNPRDLLKKCFKAVEQSARSLSGKEREAFLDDLVGLEITLLRGANEPQTFTPAQIPADFWTVPLGGYIRTPEIRRRFTVAAIKRNREAKMKKSNKRA
jgi:hypothetical protein